MHASVKPVRVRSRDESLGVEVSRIVGYRKVSEDGWRGPVRSTVAEARTDQPADA